MISLKTLIKLAKRWQRLATLKRKQISSPKDAEEGPYSSSYSRAEKGHFVVYSADEKSFMVPLAYLKSTICVQLLGMALEEFWVPGDGPIMLPWYGNFMEYALYFIQRRVFEDLQKAFFISMARSNYLSSSHLLEDHTGYRPAICRI